jgi:4-hydroxybenzoate polyprenyltransferase
VSGNRSVNWYAWWQLLRVANVFTAISNVIAGYLLTQPTEIAWLPLLLVVISSACLYESGMVLNDVCDADVDSRERPERPIPSGRINQSAARNMGVVLMVCGVAFATFAGILSKQWQTGQVAFALSVMIIGYNLGVKDTALGAICMGGCRTMNVLLGGSIGANLIQFTNCQSVWQYALGIGIYTSGISVIAKREAGVPQRRELILGVAAVLVGMATIVSLPLGMELVSVTMLGWFGLFSILFILVASIGYQLLSRRDSPRIGPAVVALIQMFILLDAMAAALAWGWPAGLAMMCLYIPMRMLSRKNPMT